MKHGASVPPPSRWMNGAFTLVGVAMFVGFGALLVSQVVGSNADATELGLMGSMAAMGLFVAWFYAAAAFARAAPVRLPNRPGRPALPLLPPRSLALGRRYRATPWIAVGFFAVCTLMFGAMTAGQWPSAGVSELVWTTAAMMLFLAAMTAVFILFMLVSLRTIARGQAPIAVSKEAWAEVVHYEAELAEGVDVGNRSLCYRDPFVGSDERERLVTLVLGANESPPWIADAHVLVAAPEGGAAAYVLRQDGGPFELDDVEIQRIVDAR